jgi:hypothetical protein
MLGVYVCLHSFHLSHSVNDALEMIMTKFYIENFYKKPA